jgi:NADPH:quinone reductase
MKAVGLTRYLPIDHPDSLLDIDLPEPAATDRDLLVDVKAISVNPVDCLTRAPKENIEAVPRVLGWDTAGVVKAVGANVTLFKPGDEVFYAGSIARAGANSERHIVDERIVGRKPSSLGFAEAAALPLTALTAWEALFDRLKISKTGADRGKTALIIGGAGGVGSIGIQLAKKLARLTVIATASRPESVAWVKLLGADIVLDHREPLAAQLKTEVDYILCFNGINAHFPAFASMIKPQGAIVNIVRVNAPLDMLSLMQKSVTFHWELMFTRSMFGTTDMIEQHHLLNNVADLIDQGEIKTTVGQHLGKINATNLKRAHQMLESGRTIGKLVLEGF